MSTRTQLKSGSHDVEMAQAPDAVMPIAIIGMSGRFPGDAENPEKLWDLIANGRSALCDIPPNRFNVDAYYHPNHERQGTINVRKAHFMNRDVSAFDAPFFTLPIAEAKAMDPQQRMALECTYEAMENAGLKMDDMSGSNTACFVGCFTRDYSDMMACDPEDLPLYQGTGTGSAIMSNRISWFFNFKGPSISLDTACSSSLVALHMGCQSLRTGESTTAVVGGTNLMLMPDIMGAMTRLHFLSPDGKCQSFDHKANGYSRGEGAAFCVLKPLHLAIQDGDMIRGVIRNTAVNQDGNTPGITLPSGQAQEALIRRVYSQARLNLADTDYVETHGTGTPAGDPVEAGALARTMAAAKAGTRPLYIGSVKSNVGHLEGASGLVQVIKAVMMLEKGKIPPSIWYEKPNPRIPMEEWNLQVPTELLSWPTDGPRRLSINSFGYGGTNAHCILDDAYHYLKSHNLRGNHNVDLQQSSSSRPYTPDSGIDTETPLVKTVVDGTIQSYFDAEAESPTLAQSPKLLLWSSNEQSGVDRNALSYATYLEQCLKRGLTEKQDREVLAKLARTLGSKRSVMPWRSFAIASSCKDALTQLQEPSTKPVRTSNNKIPPKVAYVFTGQGAQWHAMGKELFSHAIYKESLETAGRHYVSIGATFSVVAELFRENETSRLSSPELSQALCTALQVALVDLLRSWNIHPRAVVGHSSGEIAAAYARGAISREAAWTIAYHRGYLSNCIQDLNSGLRGSMLATGLGKDAIQPYLDQIRTGSANIACINSPSSTTISGDAIAIDALESSLNEHKHFARKLRVNVAYHSPHMQEIAERYRQAIGGIETAKEDETSPIMFSSLTGQKIENNADLGVDYWVSNIVSPVRFSEALTNLLNYTTGESKRRNKSAFIEHLIEVGPAAALKGPINQILASQDISSQASKASYLSVLERGRNACETALTVAGRLCQHSDTIDIRGVLQDGDADVDFLVDLLPFAWNHDLKYWAEPHAGRAHRFRNEIRKDLYGGETSDMITGEPRWRNILRLSEVPWMSQHKVQGSNLYPAAGMMVAAIEAAGSKASAFSPITGYELRDIIISKAIVVPDGDEGVETMLTMKPFRQGSLALSAAWQEFQLFSRQDSWELNCSGLIRVEYQRDNDPTFANEFDLVAKTYAEQYQAVRANCYKSQHPSYFYNQLDSIGLHYSGVFQGMSEIRKGEYQSACKVKIPDTRSIMPHQFEFSHVIHPATLDCLIQMALPASCQADEELSIPMVPVSISRLYVSAKVPSMPGANLTGFATSKVTGFDEGESQVVVSNDSWEEPLVIMEGINGKKLNSVHGSDASDMSLRKVGTVFHWQEDVSLLDPAQVRDLCRTSLQNAGAVDRKILLELEMACAIIIKRVLEACSIEETDSYAWYLKLFYQYMQRCLELVEGNKMPYQRETPTLDWLNLSPTAENELLERVSRSSTDGRALIEHGKHLPRILRGEVSALQIMMADDFLHDFYKSGLGTAQHYAQMSWYVDQEAHKNPNMRILEVGAGTAGATLPVLTKLGGSEGTAPRFSDYTFTDISVGYFEKARTKLAPWLSFLKFSTLNIEESPSDQGYEEGSYDLIIASNVLHATRSIRKTLENTRKLLKPDGKLVLTEVTPFGKMRFHMIVGSLEGWWYGEEDGRKFGPTLEISQWNQALLDAGFDGVAHDFQDFPESLDTGLSVIVSRANPPATLPPASDVVIVIPQILESDMEAAVANIDRRLTERGSQVSVVDLQQIGNLDLAGQSCLCFADAKQEQHLLPNISEPEWTALQHLILTSKDTLYITRGGTVDSDAPGSNLMTGMARSIRSENLGLSLTTLDVEYGARLDDDRLTDATLKVFDQACNSKDDTRPDWEFAIRNGNIMVQRVLLEKGTNDLAASWYVKPKTELSTLKQEGRQLTLGVGTPGRLDTLRFEDDTSLETPLKADEVEVLVKAAGLNFKDIMVAMGQLSQPALGVDCAGIISRVGANVTDLHPGQRVMTWKLGTFCNATRVPAEMIQPVPEGLSLTTAASLPVIYSTAHYSLSTVARLRLGETLLIHGAAGGVGQAAILLAQNIGAEVFATVSSEAKKEALMSTYRLPATHIFNSRDEIQFSSAIKRLTKGRGVDVILNSLSGEALRQSWRSIARGGRFVELGQKDIVGNTGLDMQPFIRNVSYHSVNMLDLQHYNLSEASRTFAEVVELVRRDIAKPVAPTTVFPFSKVEEAFRLMQTGKHIGKIVLEAKDDDMVNVLPEVPKVTTFRADATYLIAGGGGGLGRSIVAWLVNQGAKNILLLSRSGNAKASVKDLTSRLSGNGVRIEAWACDVGDEGQLAAVLQRLQTEQWPEVRGAIQGAMALHDSLFENMTHAQFTNAIRPKVHGSWNLHAQLPQDLDFFVLLSSSVGIAGSRGQGNYSAGNAYQDALAHYRRGKGLKACSIDVGMILGVGFLAEETTDDRVHGNVKSWSFLGIGERDFLRLLDAAIRGESLSGVALPPQLITGLGTGGMMARALEKYPWWFSDAKFSHLVSVDTHTAVGDDSQNGTMVSALLAQASSLEDAADIVCDALVVKLAKSLMMSVEDVEKGKPVSSYGVDSLLAVELRTWVHSEIKAEVSVFDLLSNVPLSSLSAKIAGSSKAISEDLQVSDTKQ
nr:polyketide synthase 5 [Elsinoe perseae]